MAGVNEMGWEPDLDWGVTGIVAIEAGRGETLRRFVGRRGLVIGMESFGASAPYGDLAEHFGFTAKSVAERVKAAI